MDLPRRYRPRDEARARYLPTAEEIKQSCREIRANWTDNVMRERRVDPPTPPVEIHVVSTQAFGGAILEHE